MTATAKARATRVSKTAEPVLLKMESTNTKVDALRNFLNGCVINQPGLVDAACNAYAQALNPLRDKTRPVYVVFALGYKGTGKSMTPKKLAKFIHGNEKALVKVNCGGYAEEHEVARLSGAPPGYKNSDNPKAAKLSRQNIIDSRMGSKVEISIVLLDEIEKANESIENFLLAPLEDGDADVGVNESSDFSDCIFWITGNVAAYDLQKLGKRFGITPIPVVIPSQEEVEDTVKVSLEKRFKPEFIDRVDEVVIANKLRSEDLLTIVGTQVDQLKERIISQLPRGMQFDLEAEVSAREFLLEQAMKKWESARGIRKAVQKHLERPLGALLESGEITLGDKVFVSHESGPLCTFKALKGVSTGTEADSILVNPKTEDLDKLAFQRRLAKAIGDYGLDKKKVYQIKFSHAVKAKFQQEATALTAELVGIFGCEVLKMSSDFLAEPHIFELIFRGNETQVALFMSKNQSLNIVCLTDTTKVKKKK